MSLLEKIKHLFGFSAQTDTPVKSHHLPTERSESTPTGLPPANQRREQVIRFILSKLRTYQDEPEAAPVGIWFGILCTSAEEEETYRVALWSNQPGKFQQELSRQLADNYVKLPKNWTLDYSFFVDTLPDTTYREGNLCLNVVDRKKPATLSLQAQLVTLVGQTEQPEYRLDPTQKTTFYIGRGHSVQTASGRIRTNDIVILNDDNPAFDSQKGAGNRAVSRAHATIQYDSGRQRYVLLVDAGGLPASGNKTKILRTDNRIERADIAEMAYPLYDGDQIELAGEVVLRFDVLS